MPDPVDVKAVVSELVARAEASCQKVTTNQRNKRLLEDFSVALVALATHLAQVEQERQASRILVP